MRGREALRHNLVAEDGGWFIARGDIPGYSGHCSMVGGKNSKFDLLDFAFPLVPRRVLEESRIAGCIYINYSI